MKQLPEAFPSEVPSVVNIRSNHEDVHGRVPSRLMKLTPPLRHGASSFSYLHLPDGEW